MFAPAVSNALTRSATLIVAANIGVSNAAWDLATGGAPVANPGTLLAPDQICVTRSTDAGATFGSPSCQTIANLVDKTAITIDGNGCVWIATEDLTDPDPSQWKTRVFRMSGGASSGSCSPTSALSFVESIPTQTDIQIFPGDLRPKLVTDPAGNVWLGTNFVDGPTHQGLVVLRRFDVLAQDWNFGYSASAACMNIPADNYGATFKIATLNSSTSIKIAFPYDFDVTVDATGFPVARAALQLEGASGKKFIQVVESTSSATDKSCSAPPGLSTALAAGEAFMPAIRALEFPPSVVWNVTSFSTRSAFPGSSEVQVLGYTGDILAITDLTPADWTACPRTGGYWGDYYGVAQFIDLKGSAPAVRAVSAFSDSRPASAGTGCSSGSARAKPLHISASVW